MYAKTLAIKYLSHNLMSQSAVCIIVSLLSYMPLHHLCTSICTPCTLYIFIALGIACVHAIVFAALIGERIPHQIGFVLGRTAKRIRNQHVSASQKQTSALRDIATRPTMACVCGCTSQHTHDNAYACLPAILRYY